MGFRLRGEKGQVSVVIGMMLMTFLLFFAFVVNTGMLVNAKINLQNAADMAAYSGAATQARQLTQISFINYEMRRQYKKFLFRYYVLGNMAQDTFPKTGGTGPAPWQPQSTVASYNIPVVCVMFNSQDNFCHLAELPQIVKPGSNPMDGINQALLASLEQIEDIRQKNCIHIGTTNRLLLLFWLFNTDPNFEELTQTLSSPDAIGALNVIRGLAQGLGLIPREFILFQRIKTLQAYVNQAGSTDLTLDKVNTMRTDPRDPSRYERTVNAFLSAYQTLGEHAFPSNQIWMDEIIPQTDPETQGLLKLAPNTARFTTYALDFTTGGACKPQLLYSPIDKPLTLGVYKDPTVLTYYAVRLRAKPKLLLSPFRNLELSAVAAAQPFGSRIGPKLTENDFVRSDGAPNPPPPGMGSSFHPFEKIPSLPIDRGESNSRGKGWDSQRIGNFYIGLGISGATSVSQTDFMRGYQYAMVPNPWEQGKYNIPTDLGIDPFVKFFDEKKIAAFWAPIFPPGQDSADKLKEAIQTFLDPSSLAVTVNNGGGAVAPLGSANIGGALESAMTRYLTNLRAGKGDSDGSMNESLNLFRMSEPFYTRPGDPKSGAEPVRISLPDSVLMDTSDTVKIRSSWDNTQNYSDTASGRIGYSVKIVPFETIADQSKRSASSSEGDAWSNNPEIPTDISTDVPSIKH